jgi:hypothetical protein
VKHFQKLSVKANENDNINNKVESDTLLLIRKALLELEIEKKIDSIIEYKNFAINRRLQLDKNKLSASLDLIYLNTRDSNKTSNTYSNSLLALNLFTTQINEKKMIESDFLNNSRIKNIKNNLFQINKTKFSTLNNVKLKNSNGVEPKKTRPQSQEGIIEECKNSLNELIKASKWTETAKNSCPQEEKLDDLPLASLSLSITATDVFNRSSTSSSSSLGCVGNLSSFAEPKLDEDEDLNNNKIEIISSTPHQQIQEFNTDFNSSKPPLNKPMLPRSYKNVHNLVPSFSSKLLQNNNSIINKSTSCNGNLNQKSNISNFSMIDTQVNLNLKAQSNNTNRLAQPEYVDLDSDLEKENEKFENDVQKTSENNVSCGFVQFRNNKNIKPMHALDYRSHFSTNLNGIKNLSLSNLSQTSGN